MGRKMPKMYGIRWRIGFAVGEMRMTNERLKNKIVKIVNTFDLDCRIDWLSYDIADSLIAAGLIDKRDYESMKVKVVKYKAEARKARRQCEKSGCRAVRAERALHCLARSFAEAICKDADTKHIVDGFIKDAYRQAEKELSEELENDKRRTAKED